MTTTKPRPRTRRLPENVRDVSPWHSWKVDVLLDKLSTDKNKGLAEDEVSRRQDEFGLNEITIKKREHPLVAFIRQIREPLILILIVAGIVTVLLK